MEHLQIHSEIFDDKYRIKVIDLSEVPSVGVGM